jgi:hypothetical protein
MASYDKGDIVRCHATFYDETDTLVDPDIVTFKVKRPGGGTFVETAERSSTGLYTAEVAPTTEGVWKYRFEGTGDAAGAAEGSFYVKPGAF